MPTEPAAVELVAAAKVYREGSALQPTNLVLHRGQVHALVGLNGAGKTTLMRLVLGITAPTAGRVLVRGVDVARMRSAGWAGVGHLIDTPLAYPELTVKANLQIAGRLAGLNRADAHAAALQRILLERVHEAGASVLVSSHHLDEVARIADQITVINAGRIIGELALGGFVLERRFFDLVNADVEAKLLVGKS
ncbi:ATP-binding cassette domain-containing protein [Arthrobacter sp.]|uniref:ATP-binding cassette domain-containing protein n=1 Tax=Arthrobacter sp. TaxID=1667 RepID=UPI0026DEAAE9|nr:ATP-binding cassette domain-containing protein [Arthrobacter sp.]MDO5752874.1 ATP-binding cassette domain-containing protein [Arthrobacter sp.]